MPSPLSILGMSSSSSSSSMMACSPAKKEPATLSKTAVFATSGLGGCIGWVMVHPFNTLAVRMNLASMQGKPFAFNGNYMSLYDGLSAGLARQILYATSRLGLFEVFRDKLHEIRGHTDFAARIVLGGLTGGMAAYLSCPMEVAVVRMSNDSTLPVDERRNYKGVVDTATRIAREEGMGAFWRGSNPFVTRAMLVGVFQVATMDQFKVWFANMGMGAKTSISNVFCSAMTAGFIYSVATMPLEACKNRMASQKAHATTGLPYKSVLQTLTKISADEGFLALYNGFLPYYLRCGGHTVAMFVSVQILRDFLTK